MRTAALIVLLAALPAAADDKPIAEKWTLKLVPEKLPQLPGELYGPTWVSQGFRTPVGMGHDDYLTFRKADGDQPARVDWKLVMVTRFRNPAKTTERSLPLRVENSLLEYDGQVRTAMIHDGKLLLNAGIPVGEKTWYLVYSDRFSDETVRVCEWLFEFEQDPRKQAKGRLKVRHYRNLFPKAQPETWDLPATFAVRKDDRYYRELYLRHDNKEGEGRYRLPALFLWAGKPYASVDESEGRLIEFEPQN